MVCLFKFRPVVSKIGTKENDIADFISRSYDPVDANKFFAKEGLPALNKIDIGDEYFELKADW